MSQHDTLTRFSRDMDGSMEPDENGSWVRFEDARAALSATPAAQAEPTDSMGIPLSCGKPLCAPGEHHPLCKLATPAAQAEQEVELRRSLAAAEATISERNAEIVDLHKRLKAAQAGKGEVVWPNGCNRTVPAALRYLADNERPSGGEQQYNAAHLFQLADEIESLASKQLYTTPQPQPVPDAREGAALRGIEARIEKLQAFTLDFSTLNSDVQALFKTYQAYRDTFKELQSSASSS